jgi:hypothetical protein
MTVPTLSAVINFSQGPSFTQTMTLDSGILGTNILGDSSAIIVDVSNQVNMVSTSRGRNAQADQFQTGTLTLRLVDQLGTFNPQNPASPYYQLLTPMRKVQISANWNSVNYSIFSGYITSYTTTQPEASSNEVAFTTITAVDAFRLFQNAQISTVAAAVTNELSGARINAILDQIEWPIALRDVDAGLTQMAVDPANARTALAAAQNVELSEYGSFYVSAAGFAVFQDRSVTTAGSGANPVIFADDGTGIPYFNAVWRLDDTLIYNSAQITRTGGTTQTASDAASIAKYFLHSYNQQNLLMTTDAIALQYAQSYVASRQETSIRCDLIELDLYTNDYDAGILAALSLDFFDPISITTTQPAGSTLSKTLQVFGVKMDIAANRWKVLLTTLEPIIDGFVLDSAIYGLLDTGVLTY